jgi:hypothetical protein
MVHTPTVTVGTAKLGNVKSVVVCCRDIRCDFNAHLEQSYGRKPDGLRNWFELAHFGGPIVFNKRWSRGREANDERRYLVRQLQKFHTFFECESYELLAHTGCLGSKQAFEEYRERFPSADEAHFQRETLLRASVYLTQRMGTAMKDKQIVLKLFHSKDNIETVNPSQVVKQSEELQTLHPDFLTWLKGLFNPDGGSSPVTVATA